MVLALYAVAGVMVAGGLFAIYSGSDIIVMERGWTMVISGSVMAAGGALLAGIATAVARLQMLEGEFVRLADRLAPEAPALDLPPEMTAVSIPARRSSPPPEAAPDFAAALKDLDIAPEPILAPAPAERPRAEPAPAADDDVNDELFDRTQPEPTAPEPKHEPAPAAAEAVPAEADKDAAAPAVVGTYNSGGNFYIMYSDGSIEAETPAGKFRFTSLDELKDFIAAGGDRPKATAPV
jgi:hypothetical protein